MIYLQSINNRPANFDVACAYYGILDSGYIEEEIVLIPKEELVNISDETFKEHLFIGDAEFMYTIWDRLGYRPMVPIHETRSDIKFGTLSEVQAKYYVDKQPFFVKPIKLKGFSGHMVLNDYDIDILKKLPEQPVQYTQDIRYLAAEWRCYVVDGVCRSSRYYSGDQYLCPDREFIQYICDSTTFAKTYAFDIGIQDDPSNSNFIIEYNEFWALGNYGIQNGLYFRGLKSRYFEIIANIVSLENKPVKLSF